MPNSLKGSLSASSFCRLGKKNINKKNSIACVPVSDGGDGLIDVFKTVDPSCKEYKVSALNAVYKKQKAPYLILSDKKTCIIETAKVCGLGGLKKEELLPLKATSYGVGQVILAALKKGAKTFYIGLGGVACNDGGCGMAQALGWQLLDKNLKEIKQGTSALLALDKIQGKPSFIKNIKVIGLSDVKNPLLGVKGSAGVYGPQKGANKKQVQVMEAALTKYCKTVKKDLNKNINKPRCGAAGAIASGLAAFLDADLLDGGAFILNKLKAQSAVEKADIIITAEGKLDSQTFFGKVPQAVCKLAAESKKPVIFICGQNEVKNKNLLKKHNITKVVEISSLAKDFKDSLQNPQKYLKQIFKDLF